MDLFCDSTTCYDFDIISTLLISELLKYVFKKNKNRYEKKTPGKTSKNLIKLTPQTGLQNLGNTCYFNSAIQCLYMCDSFREGICKVDSWGNDCSLHLQLRDVFRQLAEKRGSVCPSQLLAASRPPWFTQGQQQDSSELLRYLLELLHEEEQSKRPKDESTTKCEGTFDTKLGLFYKHVEPDANLTLVQRQFGGEMKNIYTCVKCRSEYHVKQNFYDLTLHFPVTGKRLQEGSERLHSPQTHFTLQQLFQEYFKAERLQGDGQFLCKSCDSLQDADKTVEISKFPNVLIVPIARFSFDFEAQTKYKIHHKMTYPKTLTMSHDRAVVGNLHPSGESHVYGLTGVIVHKGSALNYGHYYCFGRQNIPTATHRSNQSDVFEDGWYQFNDSHVAYYGDFAKVEAESMDSAYVLFYTKVQED